MGQPLHPRSLSTYRNCRTASDHIPGGLTGWNGRVLDGDGRGRSSHGVTGLEARRQNSVSRHSPSSFPSPHLPFLVSFSFSPFPFSIPSLLTATAASVERHHLAVLDPVSPPCAPAGDSQWSPPSRTGTTLDRGRRPAINRPGTCGGSDGRGATQACLAWTRWTAAWTCPRLIPGLPGCARAHLTATVPSPCGVSRKLAAVLLPGGANKAISCKLAPPEIGLDSRFASQHIAACGADLDWWNRPIWRRPAQQTISSPPTTRAPWRRLANGSHDQRPFWGAGLQAPRFAESLSLDIPCERQPATILPLGFFTSSPWRRPCTPGEPLESCSYNDGKTEPAGRPGGRVH
ncbi:hypothetical protein M432DRAFT_210221 [Thermoascus aurantiacus ATCC 26904]